MSDFFMRMIDQVGEMARSIADIDDKEEEHIISEKTSLDENLTASLNRALDSGQYSYGEDILFDYAQTEQSPYVLYAGKIFYSQLSELSDQALKQGNFSREEIYQGLKDFMKFFPPINEIKEGE